MNRELRNDIDLVALRLKRMGLPYVAKQFTKQPFATGKSWKPLVEDQLFMGNIDRRDMNKALKILWDWTMNAQDKGHRLKPVRFNTAASRVAARYLRASSKNTIRKTTMNTDRKQLIKLAAKRQVGDPVRRVLLAELQKQSTKKVDEEGIIIGYGEGPDGEDARMLKMIGPPMSVRDWIKLMEQATPGGYNAFKAAPAGRWLAEHRIKKVMPGRENSVVAYADVSSLSEEGLAELVAEVAEYGAANIDEASVLAGSPTGKTIIYSWDGQGEEGVGSNAEALRNAPGKKWLRLWWD